MGHFEQDLKQRLERNRVIPAVKDDNGLKKAIQSSHDIVFVLYGDILSLDANVHAIIRHGKMPFIHLDMIAGLSNNPVVLEYFHQHFQQNCGVITTKSTMARKAMELGIRVVQRYFMLDSLSLESAVEGLGKVRPDAIEIMPGILPRVIAHVSRETQIPIIAGGLIQTPVDVAKILARGAVAVSTSRRELWSLDPISALAGPEPDLSR
ncbi:MAG: glycerol-3-phosphate responsive antiterminator [Holophaga sp.]|nr:glycerol-3-phosphate responsive antiterminator [Holophaga sp.]